MFVVSGLDLEQRVEGLLRDAGVRQEGISKDMADLLMAARAKGTTTKYGYGFQAYCKFAQRNGYTALPTNPMHLAVYLTEMIRRHTSPGVVTSALYGIRWAHEVSGYSDPTQHPFVRNLLEASKRQDSKPVQKKDVVTPEMVRSLAESFKDSTDLLEVRDICMIITAFTGFLRFNELSHIRASDLCFREDHVVVIIPKSKTDQYRQGNEVLLSKGVTAACPYSWLQNYMRLGGVEVGESKFLFRPICKSKGKACLVGKDRSLSYTRVRECVLARLRPLGASLNLGLHSLRSGGATAAAGAGVNERCLKRHGRWRSDLSKDGYVKDSLEKRMYVSKCLGL